MVSLPGSQKQILLDTSISWFLDTTATMVSLSCRVVIVEGGHNGNGKNFNPDDTTTTRHHYGRENDTITIRTPLWPRRTKRQRHDSWTTSQRHKAAIMCRVVIVSFLW